MQNPVKIPSDIGIERPHQASISCAFHFGNCVINSPALAISPTGTAKTAINRLAESIVAAVCSIRSITAGIVSLRFLL